MDTIFLNSKNSKTFDPHRLLFNLTDKIDLKKRSTYCFIKSQYLLYMGKQKSNISKSKISAPAWNEVFQLPDGSYSVSDIQYYEKKHEKVTDNPSIRIYIIKYKTELV